MHSRASASQMGHGVGSFCSWEQDLVPESTGCFLIQEGADRNSRSCKEEMEG